LHLKFEELHNDNQSKIDVIAERILTLDTVLLHTFEDTHVNNKLEIGKNIRNDEKAIKLIVSSLGSLLAIERVILKKSEEIDDEGTNSMMGNFIAEQEKTIWMLEAWQQG
jgi:starvation-inducible DNA-binding protein